MGQIKLRVNNRGLRGIVYVTHQRVTSTYQRKTTDPHAKPPPIASVTIRSPGLICPRAQATDSASGMDAADVLP